MLVPFARLLLEKNGSTFTRYEIGKLNTSIPIANSPREIFSLNLSLVILLNFYERNFFRPN